MDRQVIDKEDPATPEGPDRTEMRDSFYCRWNDDLAARYDVDEYLSSLSWPFRLLERMRYFSLLRLVRQAKPSAVLDAGCGSGVLLEMLSDRDRPVVGLDFSATNIRRCRHRLPQVPLFHADIQRLPIRDRSFPMIICTEVIEHLPNPEQALHAMARALSSAGTLLITIPNDQLIMRAKKVILRLPGMTRFLGLESGGPTEDNRNLWHLHVFSPPTFEPILKRHFQIMRRISLPLPFLPIRWIYAARKIAE